MQENIMALLKNLGVINMLGLILSTLFFVAVITVIGLWILMFKDILRK